ncbi:MAG: N-acetyltransferase [Burkholderiaceae bacterium]|nr:N-acetyltransferase [Burkholderiaceae bacterium]
MTTSTKIRRTTAADLPALATLAHAAFGPDEGPEIAALLHGLLGHPIVAGGHPQALSLAAADLAGRVCGHVLFTPVQLAPAPTPAVPAAILAPLAVDPALQRQGLGRRLAREGLAQLRDSGTALVFVLGDPRYYTRLGFAPAARWGLQPQHAIPAAHADAWMVQALQPGVLERLAAGGTTRRVVCTGMLGEARYWGP